MTTRLQTERLVIRTLNQRDADAWIAMASTSPSANGGFRPTGPSHELVQPRSGRDIGDCNDTAVEAHNVNQVSPRAGRSASHP